MIFKNFDEIAFLNDLLAVPWSEIEMFNDIDESLEAWYSLFIKTVDKHAPIKTHRIKNDIQQIIDYFQIDTFIRPRFIIQQTASFSENNNFCFFSIDLGETLVKYIWIGLVVLNFDGKTQKIRKT